MFLGNKVNACLNNIIDLDLVDTVFKSSNSNLLITFLH